MHLKSNEKPSSLQAALDLADTGIPVFPVRSHDKKPLVKWKALATTDSAQIRTWWRKWPKAMPAFPTGQASGIDVLDLDLKKGKDGAAVLRGKGLDPDTLSNIQLATPTGGRHLYFAHTPGRRNSQDEIGPGVDVRAEGGFVVAPMATNAKGTYGFRQCDLGDLEAAVGMVGLPVWPAGLPMRPRPQKGPGKATAEPSGLSFEALRSAVMAIPIKGREEAFGTEGDWFKVCRIIFDESAGSEEGHALWHAFSEGWGGYDYQEADGKWNRDAAYTGDRATVWTILQVAQNHGWTHPDFEAWKAEDNAEDFTEEMVAFGGISPDEMAEIDAYIADLFGSPSDTGTVPESGGLTFETPSDCANLPARPYVLKGLLAKGDVAAIVGAPGAGKSLLAPLLGYAVARGAEVFGRRTKPGKVFYVAAEDTHGMRARLSALRQDYGDADDFKLVGGVSDLLSKKGDLRALRAAVKTQRPSLVIIDTVAVAFPGLEENSAEGMGQVVAAARSLTAWGAAVVLIHHDTKAGDGLPRGHSILNGALDVSLYLKKDRDTGVVTVEPSKNRNGTTDQTLAFTIGTRVVGTDEDGDAITAAIAEQSDAAKAKVRLSHLTGQQRAAFDILTSLNLGRVSVPKADWRKACHESSAFSASDHQRGRNTAFRRAVEELIRKGRVAEVGDDFTVAAQDGADFTDDMVAEDGKGVKS